MRIQHNIASMNTQRMLGMNVAAANKNLEKLSSGYRVNRAGDDAAGLAISEKMRGQIRGLQMASKNAQDGISLIQTAEGALAETHNIIQRMRELAVQSANDTNTDSDRKELQAEVKQLISEIDRIANTTEFNTRKLLDGSAKGVAEAKYGTSKINNNSKIVIAQTALADVNAAVKTAGISNGAYVLVRVNDTVAPNTAGTATFNDVDYEMYGPNGQKVASTDYAVVDGSITLNASLVGAAVTYTLTANADTGITGSMDMDMKVGESITFSFSKFEAASSDLENSILLQIGANGGQFTFLSVGSMKAADIGVASVDISTKWGAQAAIEVVNNALEKVSSQRGVLGAMQNRLEYTINNLGASAENLQAAEARIRDVDMAAEMSNFTKNNILTQAAQAMLAQANQLPQGVLQLLQ